MENTQRDSLQVATEIMVRNTTSLVNSPKTTTHKINLSSEDTIIYFWVLSKAFERNRMLIGRLNGSRSKNT